MTKKGNHLHFVLSKKGLIFLRFDGWIPRLELHEKYKPTVKWTLRSITAIAITANLLSLPWYFSIPIALALLAIEQFFERSLFLFTSMYVHPLGFQTEPGKWDAMAYLFPSDAKQNEQPLSLDLNAVGLVFNDGAYAIRFVDFLMAWNHGDREDKDNNIRLSFITDEDRYYVFLYPSHKKKTVRRFFAKVRRSGRRANSAKEHIGIEISQIFYKSFDTMTAGYSLGAFVKKQKKNMPFYLMPVHSSGLKMGLAHPDHWIKKWHYTAKNRHELTPDDYEYLLWQKLGLS